MKTMSVLDGDTGEASNRRLKVAKACTKIQQLTDLSEIRRTAKSLSGKVPSAPEDGFVLAAFAGILEEYKSWLREYQSSPF